MILSNLKTYVLADIAAGNAIELISPSGRGKSDFSWELYKDLCEMHPNKSIGFVDMFLATQTPPDLIGYQFKGTSEYEGRTFARSEPSIPLWMQTKFVRLPGEPIKEECRPAWACDMMVVVLDEYGQGEADVKRCSAQLFLKGEIGPWRLPHGSVRIACSNKAGGRYGVTKDFDFVINRKSTYNLTDDVVGWLNWADQGYSHEGQQWGVMPVTKAFAKQNPNVLFETEPKDQGPWCTPRSLCATDRFLQMVEKHTGKIDPSNSAVGEGVSAKIGVPASGAFMGWLQFRLELPQYEEVIAAPADTPVPGKPDLQLLMAYELASRTQKEDLPKVIAYVGRMPKDMSVTYIKALIGRQKEMIVEPALGAWAAKNATLLAVVQTLSAKK
jgi:hypothetical protein